MAFKNWFKLNHDSKWFSRIWFKLTHDSKGFPKFRFKSTHDSKSFPEFWFKSSLGSKGFPEFWFKSTHDSKDVLKYRFESTHDSVTYTIMIGPLSHWIWPSTTIFGLAPFHLTWCDFFRAFDLKSFREIDSNRHMTQAVSQKVGSIQVMIQADFQGINSESTHDSSGSPVLIRMDSWLKRLARELNQNQLTSSGSPGIDSNRLMTHLMAWLIWKTFDLESTHDSTLTLTHVWVLLINARCNIIVFSEIYNDHTHGKDTEVNLYRLPIRRWLGFIDLSMVELRLCRKGHEFVTELRRPYWCHMLVVFKSNL